jgi:diguanylate cyclase (GGDEF)-like protein/hemerythrin-like metal-binding protein
MSAAFPLPAPAAQPSCCPRCQRHVAHIEHLQRTIDELRLRAGVDHLTGAGTRAVIEDALARELGRHARFGHPVALAFGDIDRFKQINDRFGHAIGDEALKQVYAILQRGSRTTDLVGRWGGEEFAIVMPNTGVVGARVIAERLRAALAAATFAHAAPVTMSFGVAEAVAGEPWQGLVDRADRAMYEAKAAGRDRVVVAPTPRAEAGNDSVAAGFLRLVWRDAYRCGHPLIDRQHEALFDDANAVLAAAAGGPPSETAVLFAALVEDCRIHFRDEERILHAAGYADAAAHAAVHDRLLISAERVLGQLRAGACSPGVLFDLIACELVAGHILRDDRRHFPTLAAPRA